MTWPRVHVRAFCMAGHIRVSAADAMTTGCASQRLTMPGGRGHGVWSLNGCCRWLKPREIASPRQVAIERAADAFGGAIDGDVKIALGILDGQGRSALEAHFDAATLVSPPRGPLTSERRTTMRVTTSRP
jgi:hypothetical protein